MKNDYKEMVEWTLPQVVRINRAITKPVIKKRTGLKIVSEGESFGAIVTNVDIGASQALLEGNIPGVAGLRSLYPGSFSEEQDSPERITACNIYEVDPLDGTGDFKKTYDASVIMPPTTLVTKLKRKDSGEPYTPVVSLIFETVHEYGLVSDGTRIGFFTVTPEGEIYEVPCRLIKYDRPFDLSLPIFINRRPAYPQQCFDTKFVPYLREHFRLDIRQVSVGGAGMQALHLFRNYIEPSQQDCPAFHKLKPLTISFNAQPDWKTWDTDPADVIAKAIGLPERTTIFGEKISDHASKKKENAAATNLKDMWHPKGCVLSTDGYLQQLICQIAKIVPNFGDNLLTIDY